MWLVGGRVMRAQRGLARAVSTLLGQGAGAGRLMMEPSQRSSPCTQMMTVRFMNRNARKPKKANHGKRPCSHARRREKMKPFYMKSSRFKMKLFGFY